MAAEYYLLSLSQDTSHGRFHAFCPFHLIFFAQKGQELSA